MLRVPPTCRMKDDDGGGTRPEAGEVKSGILEVTDSNTSRHQTVFVRVYKTSSEHFAAVYPIKASLVSACQPITCINLKSCCVDIVPGSERQFKITQRSCEGASATFNVPERFSESDCVKSWILALKDMEKIERMRTLSDSRNMLPVLLEEDE